MAGVSLRFGGKNYFIKPEFRLVSEIESELGGCPALQESFSRGGWRVSDLVVLVQMMLQAAGESVDYAFLGNRMLKEGLGPYLEAAKLFLEITLSSK